MFKSKTLFVIGAGASCEAGLPSGEVLKGHIADLLDIRFGLGGGQQSGDHQITHALRGIAGANGSANINPYLHKAWSIRDVVPSAAISIDNFLDAHRGDEMMEVCGKLGIVKSILDAERASKLCDDEHGSGRFTLAALAGTWYVNFFQMLTENVRKADVTTVFDNVAIITFNYDRCIERFLVQALADYYQIEVSESEKIVGGLSIYHPYGTVGPLHWQDRLHSLSFGANAVNLQDAVKRIKTFTEGLDDDELMSNMHTLVEEAETLVFLGFAFHPMNMQLLTPKNKAKMKRVFATTLGMSDADERVIVDDIWRMLGRADLPLNIKSERHPTLDNSTCRVFFQRYFRSLSASAT